MEIISIILLIGLLLFFIYRILKTMPTHSESQTKLSTEQKKLKKAKILYFICSTPFILLYLGIIFHLNSILQEPASSWVSGHAFGSLLGVILVFLLSWAYLTINYKFIETTFKRKIKDKNIIVFLSCLPGLSYGLFFISGDLSTIGIPFLIIVPIINAIIISAKIKKKINAKNPKKDTWGEYIE